MFRIVIYMKAGVSNGWYRLTCVVLFLRFA
nr:MAG TPA: hypothetical protein [Caudoviricetes sp.]